MPTQREKIIKKALELLENQPDGLRYSGLIKEIKNSLPEIPKNTIRGTIWNLDKKVKQIAKPERGVFILTKYLSQEKQTGVLKKQASKEIAGKIIAEIKKPLIPNKGKFYSLFADYLVNDLGECTKAIALGGKKFGDKWASGGMAYTMALKAIGRKAMRVRLPPCPLPPDYQKPQKKA